MFFEQLPEELKRTAYPLQEFGANEYAWSYEEVKKVVLYLAERTYAILGGGVWRREGNVFELTYDNWYLNYNDSMSWEEYVEQSKVKALNYVDFYRQRNGDEFYYAPFASLTKIQKPTV